MKQKINFEWSSVGQFDTPNKELKMSNKNDSKEETELSKRCYKNIIQKKQKCI